MEERAQFWKMTGRGVSLAIIVCLAAVLIFALVIQFTGLPESVIMPVNQFIKVLAIFIGLPFSYSRFWAVFRPGSGSCGICFSASEWGSFRESSR